MAYPLKIIDHPLATHKLTLLREAETDLVKARNLIYELGLMLAVEATRELTLGGAEIRNFEGQTYRGQAMEQLNVVAIPIVRSGLVMGEAFAAILPSARTGHLGIHHDYLDDKPAVTYMVSIPSAPDLTDFFVIDSLIGTGETVRIAANELRDAGVESSQLHFMVLSIHEQGVAAFYSEQENAGIPIFAFEIRSETDDRGLPSFGFGNTADRIYGTGEAR